MSLKIVEGLRTIAKGFEMLADGMEEYLNDVEIIDCDDEDCTYVEGASPFKKVVSFTEAVEKGLYNAAEDEEILEDEDADDLVSDEVESEDELENESEDIDEEINEDDDIDEYVEDVEFSVEELEQMDIGELTTIAIEMGIDVKKLKKKEQLIEAIISAQDSANEDEEIEEVEDEVEEAEDEEIEIEDEPVDDMERIERELQNYSEEELADILNSVGITPRGKKQALISKVLEAIEKGLLEWVDEDVENENTEDIEEDSEIEDNDEVADEEYNNEDELEDEEIDEDEFFNKSIHKERAEVLETLDEDFEEAYKNKEITDKDIDALLVNYFDKKELKAMKKDEKIEYYKEIIKRLIDDGGNLNPIETMYYVNDRPCCCGALLKKADGMLICEICGSEYKE